MGIKFMVKKGKTIIALITKLENMPLIPFSQLEESFSTNKKKNISREMFFLIGVKPIKWWLTKHLVPKKKVY